MTFADQLFFAKNITSWTERLPGTYQFKTTNTNMFLEKKIEKEIILKFRDVSSVNYEPHLFIYYVLLFNTLTFKFYIFQAELLS